MKRRQFLKAGSAAAMSAFLLPLASQQLLGKSNSLSHTIPNVKLNNGTVMPLLGFGTLYLTEELGVRSVADAIHVGYRLIDTATIYGNEESVGRGIKQSGIDRKELFITSKVWVDDYGFEETQKAFETSLNKLGTDYLDLYLIHRPRGDVKGAWLAMEKLYNEGKIKAIGISNFEPHQLDELLTYASIQPTVNQVETHSFFQQEESKKAMNQADIQMEAWSPFAQGRNDHFTNEVLAEIGGKYGKTNAQVSLRWHLQRGIVAIPRTSKKEHMVENLNIFDFELSKKDMKTISKLDLNTTQFPEWE